MRAYAIAICAAVIAVMTFEGGFTRSMKDDSVTQTESYLAFSANTDPGEYSK